MVSMLFAEKLTNPIKLYFEIQRSSVEVDVIKANIYTFFSVTKDELASGWNQKKNKIII